MLAHNVAAIKAAGIKYKHAITAPMQLTEEAIALDRIEVIPWVKKGGSVTSLVDNSEVLCLPNAKIGAFNRRSISPSRISSTPFSLKRADKYVDAPVVSAVAINVATNMERGETMPRPAVKLSINFSITAGCIRLRNDPSMLIATIVIAVPVCRRTKIHADGQGACNMCLAIAIISTSSHDMWRMLSDNEFSEHPPHIYYYARQPALQVLHETLHPELQVLRRPAGVAPAAGRFCRSRMFTMVSFAGNFDTEVFSVGGGTDGNLAIVCMPCPCGPSKT